MKAQTATEYLILLAVVIIIAVIVVSALGGIPGIGGGAGATNVAAQTLDVGIADFSVHEFGVFMTVHNNVGESITIDAISIDDELIYPKALVYPFQLRLGGERQIYALPYLSGNPDGYATIVINYTNSVTDASYFQSFDYEYDPPDEYVMREAVALYHYEDDYNDSINDYDFDSTFGSLSLNQEGRFGTGVVLMSNYSQINYSENDIYDLHSDKTIALWINVVPTEDNRCGNILFKMEPSGGVNSDCGVFGSNYGYYVYNQNGYLNTMVQSGGSGGSFGFSQIANGQWKQLTITANGTTASSYYGGSLAGSGDITPLVNADQYFIIGYLGEDNGHLRAVTGLYDNLIIWNRTLTEREVRQLYEFGR